MRAEHSKGVQAERDEASIHDTSITAYLGQVTEEVAVEVTHGDKAFPWAGAGVCDENLLV